MYIIVMRNSEGNTLDIDRCPEADIAELKAARFSAKFPAYLFEVWKGNALYGTWENGREW